jgi:hypothetical protein
MTKSLHHRNRRHGPPIDNATSTATAALSQQSPTGVSRWWKITKGSKQLHGADDSTPELSMPLLGEFYD